MSQENVILWDINGHQYVLDLEDYETAQKYENAFANMKKAEITNPKDGNESELIKNYYELYKKLYDDLFGEGEGIKILGEKINSRVCTAAYDSFLGFIEIQVKTAKENQNKVITRYTNRTQRRHGT